MIKVIRGYLFDSYQDVLPFGAKLLRNCFTPVSASGHETIAARLRDQQARIRRVRLDLLAQAVDVGFQRMGRDPGIVAPHLVQQHIPRNNAFGRAIKKLQNIGFLFGQADLPVLRRLRPMKANSSARHKS